MKLLVTGGAGFIGANFIYEVLETRADAQIVCLDLLTYAGRLETIQPALDTGRVRFVRGDITDSDAVRDVIRGAGFDAVVNFAAESHVDRSITQPDIFLRTNIMGTQVLMDACREFGVERFHQVSTDEVYGDLPLDRPDLLFTEKTPLNPSSPYSASKASADLLALAYYRTYKLPVTVSRCSNNYGPYQFPEKLIPLMISRAQSNEKLPVYGKGENVRDWLHVRDHCRAIMAILERGTVGEVYNIGGNSEWANIDLVKLLLKLLGKPETLIEYVTDRPGHDLRYAIDSSKINSELGWSPCFAFEDRLAQTVNWHLNNRDWWQNI